MMGGGGACAALLLVRRLGAPQDIAIDRVGAGAVDDGWWGRLRRPCGCCVISTAFGSIHVDVV